MSQPTLTAEVAAFLRDLLASQQLQVGAPDLLPTAQLAAEALAQLNAVLKESE